jgi:hypothetical protein
VSDRRAERLDGHPSYIFFGSRAVEEDILKEDKMSVQNYRLKVKRTKKCRLGTVNS